MTGPPVSVVVVSHGRPQALARCLTGLSQLIYPAFEIIVVTDGAGLAAVVPWSGRIKTIRHDEENISAARNLGIGQAAGDIVAFIDDDAVPEPTWLDHLCGALASPAVAAGGHVIGRNGISLQWGARVALSDATAEPLAIGGQDPEYHRGQRGQAIKTEGTNMAFRRDTLLRNGGFDPVFRFYLDETDLNLRLAAQGAVTAIVPRAIVHHGFEASARRTAERVPLTLFEIGASVVAFLRRHAAEAEVDALVAAERSRQSARLHRHLIDGRLEPRDVRRLIGSFDAGCRAGADRPVSPPPPIPDTRPRFLAFARTTPKDHRIVSGRPWQAADVASRARLWVAQGHRVSAIVLSPTIRRHRIVFHPAGYWLQTGGLFGASDRSDPVFRYWRFRDRVTRERQRLAEIREP